MENEYTAFILRMYIEGNFTLDFRVIKSLSLSVVFSLNCLGGICYHMKEKNSRDKNESKEKVLRRLLVELPV